MNCLRALGLTTKGGSSSDILKKRIAELKCSTEHFRMKKNSSPNAKYSLDEILTENSPYANITRLKTRLIKEGRLSYECVFCGNKGEWLGHKMTLQLDHINGKNNDHRIENLRFLCPNCHSITPTYAGKNKRGISLIGKLSDSKSDFESSSLSTLATSLMGEKWNGLR